jgi:hypothetical protein
VNGSIGDPDNLVVSSPIVIIDLTKLSEAELIDLNRRIVERLNLMRSAKQLIQLARFSVGMIVEFNMEDGRTIRGTISRLNRQTATVVTSSGRWRVTPSLLRVVEQQDNPARVVSISERRSGR